MKIFQKLIVCGVTVFANAVAFELALIGVRAVDSDVQGITCALKGKNNMNKKNKKRRKK